MSRSKHRSFSGLALLTFLLSAWPIWAAPVTNGGLSPIDQNRIKLGAPPAKGDEPKPTSRWSSSLSYGVFTDMAEEESPRAYGHSLAAALSYSFRTDWLLGLGGNMRTTTVGGQIYRDEFRDESETYRPMATASLTYKSKAWERHMLSGSANWTFLLDEASRLEGYVGVGGVGGSLLLNFGEGLYSIRQKLGMSSMVNTFEFSSRGRPNPDFWATYGLELSFRLVKDVYLSGSFGLKATQFLDGFVGYEYNNSLGLSYSVNSWSLALSYENGGFTEDGRVDLWYIDQYRRVYAASVGYSF